MDAKFWEGIRLTSTKFCPNQATGSSNNECSRSFYERRRNCKSWKDKTIIPQEFCPNLTGRNSFGMTDLLRLSYTKRRKTEKEPINTEKSQEDVFVLKFSTCIPFTSGIAACKLLMRFMRGKLITQRPKSRSNAINKLLKLIFKTKSLKHPHTSPMHSCQNPREESPSADSNLRPTD